jgi:hypothetical protein
MAQWNDPRSSGENMCNSRAKNGAQVGEKALSSINGVPYRTSYLS